MSQMATLSYHNHTLSQSGVISTDLKLRKYSNIIILEDDGHAITLSSIFHHLILFPAILKNTIAQRGRFRGRITWDTEQLCGMTFPADKFYNKDRCQSYDQIETLAFNVQLL